jgi:hypothetical protein
MDSEVKMGSNYLLVPPKRWGGSEVAPRAGGSTTSFKLLHAHITAFISSETSSEV